MKTFNLILSIFLFLIPLSSLAAPGETTNYLMSEPASLFDLGFAQLTTRLSNAKVEVAKGVPLIIWTNYNYDDDKIEITGLVVTNNQEFLKNTADICKLVIANIRTELLINPKTLTPYNSDSVSNFFVGTHFYSARKIPPDIENSLERMVNLIGIVRLDNTDKSPITTCKAGLIDKDIYISNSK